MRTELEAGTPAPTFEAKRIAAKRSVLPTIEGKRSFYTFTPKTTRPVVRRSPADFGIFMTR